MVPDLKSLHSGETFGLPKELGFHNFQKRSVYMKLHPMRNLHEDFACSPR